MLCTVYRYTSMPSSKLKLGPLRVPSLGTRIEENSIGVSVMTSGHHNPEKEYYSCKRNLFQKKLFVFFNRNPASLQVLILYIFMNEHTARSDIKLLM